MQLSTKISSAGPKFRFFSYASHVVQPGISGTCQTVLYLPCHSTMYQWDVSNRFCIYLVMRPCISGTCQTAFCTYIVMRPGISGYCQTVFVLTLSCDQVSRGPVKQFCTYLVMRPGIRETCQTVFVLTLSCDQVSVGPV